MSDINRQLKTKAVFFTPVWLSTVKYSKRWYVLDRVPRVFIARRRRYYFKVINLYLFSMAKIGRGSV